MKDLKNKDSKLVEKRPVSDTMVTEGDQHPSLTADPMRRYSRNYAKKGVEVKKDDATHPMFGFRGSY